MTEVEAVEKLMSNISVPKEEILESHRTSGNDPSCASKCFYDIMRSPEMESAQRGFHNVYDKLPENKKPILRAVQALITNAWDAYNSAMGRNGEQTDKSKIYSSGTSAYWYFEQFKFLSKCFGGLNPSDTIEKIETILSWTEKKEWTSHIVLIDNDGNKIHKSVKDMNDDMIRFLETKHKLEVAVAQARANDAASKESKL